MSKEEIMRKIEEFGPCRAQYKQGHPALYACILWKGHDGLHTRFIEKWKDDEGYQPTAEEVSKYEEQEASGKLEVLTLHANGDVDVKPLNDEYDYHATYGSKPRGPVGLSDLESVLAHPGEAEARADLLLIMTGEPVDSNVAREQIRAFLLGTLLKRGLRSGEAAAVVERRKGGYHVRMVFREEDGGSQLGSVTVPLEGYANAAFERALKKEGIRETDDPSLFIVTKRQAHSQSN